MANELEQALQAFDELVEEYASAPPPDAEGTGNFRCEHCVACNDCRFCTECDNCRECTYCYGCRDCLSLTQCRQCDASEKLSHSDLCSECVGGSYLTLCLDCEDCVQCFGCVGLSGEEFCILNEKLPRKEYFARVKELRRQLEARTRQGWLPPWLQDRGEGSDEPAPHDGPPMRGAELPLGEPTAARQAAGKEDPSERAATGEWRAAGDRRPPSQRPIVREALPEAEAPPEAEVPPEAEAPPFPELPADLYDSGLWSAPDEEIPPPPPYTGRASAPRQPNEDSARISISADAMPTLTRGSRPQRDKPAASPRRASVRRGRPPPRR